MFKSKFKASIIHLGLSILLVGLSIGSTIFFFFPTLFIDITDFKEIASIIISVDLILGPLLTFVVFKPHKKSLKFDLSVIAAIQLTALIYGAYALYLVHPVFITFNIDRFTLVSALDAHPENAKFEEYNVSKLSTGKMAFSKMPNDPKKRDELLFSMVDGGGDLDQRAEYYEPFNASNIAQVVSKSLNPKLIFKTKDAKKIAKDFLSKNKNKLDSFAFLPLNSLKKDAIIVLDKKTAKPVATLNLNPWKYAEKN